MPKVTGANSLSPQKMGRESFLQRIHLVIPLASLVQNHIDNLIVLADILGRRGHDFVHDITKEETVTSRIISYTRDKFSDCLLVLKEMSEITSKSNSKTTYFRDILQINY
jgi:hypothetical protein